MQPGSHDRALEIRGDGADFLNCGSKTFDRRDALRLGQTDELVARKHHFACEIHELVEQADIDANGLFDFATPGNGVEHRDLGSGGLGQFDAALRGDNCAVRRRRLNEGWPGSSAIAHPVSERLAGDGDDEGGGEPEGVDENADLELRGKKYRTREAGGCRR